MPSWEEVERVGERAVAAPGVSEEPRKGDVRRGDAVGRLASVWRLSEYKELSKGKAEGVALLSAGGMALGAVPATLMHVDAICLWPIAVAPDGSVYTGSWADGCLRKTDPDGETAVVLETEDAAIQAIAVDEQGTVFAAATPSGTILRIGAGGKAEEVCRLEAQSIWALVVGNDGELWAGTGPEGRLYRISRNGEPRVAFTVADRHITGVAMGPEGTVYLGTSPLGKVYAVAPSGEARSVGEIEKAAVQSIGVDGKGNVYVGTSPEARVLKITPEGVVRELLRVRKAKHVTGLLVRPDGTVYAAAGPGARVHVIPADGHSAELCDPKTAFVAAMATGSSGGDIYFTAADTGRVVKLEAGGGRRGSYTSPILDAGARARWGSVRWRGQCPEGAEVEVLTRSGATGHPDDTWSEWQSVAGQAEAAVGNLAARFLQCRVDLRGRGVEEAGGSHSGEIALVPQVDVLEISYLPANRAPEVSITSPKGNEVWSDTQRIRWSGRDADKDKLTYEVYWSADRGESWTRIESAEEPKEDGETEKDEESARNNQARSSGVSQSTDDRRISAGEQWWHSSTRAWVREVPGEERERAAGTRRMRDVRPTAFGGELGDEEMEAELSVLGEDLGEIEVEAEEEPAEGPERGDGVGVEATSMKWDTGTVADGEYWIKVVGSDGRSNPDDPRTGEEVSRSVVVDNTPPELIVDRARGEDDPPPDEVTVFERCTYVTSAEFRVDEGEWLAGMAKDGMFDGRYEKMVLDEDRLPAGAHEVEVRVRDAAGNVGSVSLRYRR
jgi:hypothetical protein